MPGRDQSGPAGEGRMTGRGMGVCGGGNRSGRGMGAGGRGRGTGQSRVGLGRGTIAEPEIPTPQNDATEAALKQEIESVQTKLDELHRRLDTDTDQK